MPSASELERVEQEREPMRDEGDLLAVPAITPATKFEVTIQFGPHQAKLDVDTEVVSGSDDEALTHYLVEHLAPHLKEMYEAERRTHERIGR